MHVHARGRPGRPWRPGRPRTSFATALLVGWVALALPGLPAPRAFAEGEAAPTAEPAPSADLELVACAEAVARRVQSRYEAIRDLRADFEQETRSVSFGSGSMAGAGPVRGEVVFAKPGRMRWTYREPAPSLMVSDGETLWLYDPVAREASRLPVDEGYLSGAALQFLMGQGDVLETFTVVAEKCDADGEAPVDLDLLPREPASYERMGLRADPKSGLIQQTTIVDLFGNQTTMRFENVRTDTGVAAETFRFEPPADASVVDLMAPP
ncbi:MAG: LolA family protein [Myxococcota bacterium]